MKTPPLVQMDVSSVNKVVRNLRYFRGLKTNQIMRGLLAAGHYIMEESLKIVPVQTGNLKASWFVRKAGPLHVVIGYAGVEYAAWVHEIPNPPHAHGAEFNIKHMADIQRAKGTPWGTAQGGMFPRKPEEQYKYLERPVKDTVPEVLRIIKQEAMKGI